MTTVESIIATEEHCALVASRVRESDRDEIWAAARIGPYEAMTKGVLYSSRAWAGIINGDTVCVFGVCPESIVSTTGTPWMIGTDLIERHQFAFVRHCRPRVREMLTMYDRLVNYVDDRNRLAIRWLRWLGFEIGSPQPYGYYGLPFRRFEMTKEHAACARHC